MGGSVLTTDVLKATVQSAENGDKTDSAWCRAVDVVSPRSVNGAFSKS